MSSDTLVAAALQARRHAVADYSGFQVGCALLSRSGVVVTGCNIENATLGLTLCAERVALFKALSDGLRDFEQVCVVTAAKQLTPPCGACRQVLWEFCGDISILMANTGGDSATVGLADLLPRPFDGSHFR